MLRSALRPFFAALTFSLLGCAAAPPPPAPVVTCAAPAPERADPGPLSYESETGGLNEEAMERAFGSLARQLQGCMAEGTARLSPLGGHLKLTVRVQRDGATKWVYLSESTLGDRETEKCVLDLARSKTWPLPVGGEGLASKSFDIDAMAQPVELDAKKVKTSVAKARSETAKCRRGVPGIFMATAYVRPDGRVLSAGVAPPDEKGEDVADCIVDALRRVRFRPHGGKAAKVSFEI